MTGFPSSATQLAPGYKLDRYELLCPIAEGGMASVWVARQRGKHGFEKLVAIKTILPKFAGDIRFQEMFLDEARIAAKIEHLNVAQIFDLGEEHEILYLAMEYVEGDALSKLNRACQKSGIKIPTGVVLKVLADTCAGLHEAHELKDSSGRALEIVHRDVSPHNILVSTKGVAKLIDFGIATARSRAGGETNSGVLKGKIQYMAPEQALGRPVDRRADIWAVGAILYALLAGKPPYEADNPLATLHLLGSGRPPVPLPASVHPAIATIVRKALSFVPDNRYANAEEMRDALERAMTAAKVTTTASEVAAFAAAHLGERVDKRRQAIEAALTAATERQRTEERYRATGALPAPPERGSGWPIPPPASTPSLGAIRRDGGGLTIPDAPVAKAGSIDALAKMTARTSEPPAHASSYATFGSAAVETLTQTPRARRGTLTIFGVVGVAGAVLAGLSLGVLRSHPPARFVGVSPVTSSALALPATAATTAAFTPMGAATTASSAAPPVSASWPMVPTVNASSLPKASSPAFVPYVPRRPPTPVAPPKSKGKLGPDESSSAEPASKAGSEAAPPQTPAPRPQGTVDDGF